jgi:hypothetical protein
MMEKETASDVRGIVETTLGEAYEQMGALRKERDTQPDISREDFARLTGKIRGMAEVIDVLAGLGFSIGRSE